MSSGSLETLVRHDWRLVTEQLPDGSVIRDLIDERAFASALAKLCDLACRHQKPNRGAGTS